MPLRRFVQSCFFAAATLFAVPVFAQQAGSPPQAPSSGATPAPSTSGKGTAAPVKRRPPQPAAQAAPGGGPGMVWVNLNTSTYHCPGTRFYGKTANGRYMTESAAKSAGAKGSGGKTCNAAK